MRTRCAHNPGLVRVGTKARIGARDIVGDNGIATFAYQFALGVLDNVIGLGRKSDYAPLALLARELGQNIDRFDKLDAIQAFGKYRIYPKRMGIDMLSVSGHKIHGPKGSGFLYIDEKVKIRPLILGGGQQNGMRSGTDNVPGIAGLSLAAKTIYNNLDKKVEKMRMLKQHARNSERLLHN